MFCNPAGRYLNPQSLTQRFDRIVRGRIKNELAIDLPYARHYTVKTTPRFSELKAVVTEDIRAESLKTAQMEH